MGSGAIQAVCQKKYLLNLIPAEQAIAHRSVSFVKDIDFGYLFLVINSVLPILSAL